MALAVLGFSAPAQAAAGAEATAKKAKKPCRAAKKGPLYRTPGYKGTCRSPKTRPQDPLPPVALGENGRDPQVLVDAAGTAHIVWNQDGGEAGPDLLRYCRLKRGSKSCDNPPQTASLFPAQPGVGNSPQFNEDLGGPRVVAVGDDLVFVSHRCRNVIGEPERLHTSRGRRGTWVDPTTRGDSDLAAGWWWGTPSRPAGRRCSARPEGASAVRPDLPDTRTGGTFFRVDQSRYLHGHRGQPRGGRPRPGLLRQPGVGGRPADDGVRRPRRQHVHPPVVRQRRYSNPATWSQAQTSGTEPRLAAGPGGEFLVTEPSAGTSLQVRRLAGITPQRATNVRTGGHGARDLFEDPGGSVRLASVDRDGPAAELLERASTTGRKLEEQRVVARAGEGIDEVDLGAPPTVAASG